MIVQCLNCILEVVCSVQERCTDQTCVYALMLCMYGVTVELISYRTYLVIDYKRALELDPSQAAARQAVLVRTYVG